MIHSHMPVQHLLKQVESYRSRPRQRDIRPDWLTTFIEDVAELFEPATGVARVGFECRLNENGWVVGMFLGGVETVGGKQDGVRRHVAFQFDLAELLEHFHTVDRFFWGTTCDESRDELDGWTSCVTIDGRIDGHALRLQVFSVPPVGAGPALREFPGGRLESV